MTAGNSSGKGCVAAFLKGRFRGEGALPTGERETSLCETLPTLQGQSRTTAQGFALQITAGIMACLSFVVTAGLGWTGIILPNFEPGGLSHGRSLERDGQQPHKPMSWAGVRKEATAGTGANWSACLTYIPKS